MPACSLWRSRVRRDQLSSSPLTARIRREWLVGWPVGASSLQLIAMPTRRAQGAVPTEALESAFRTPGAPGTGLAAPPGQMSR
jgi:hypothetical protein